ncbi:sensor histidine kinase [Streptomonospora alba]|uniref:sensor histidine kinase n=1 Tax=Streptomonospora alba TaxID=183763 RepID=UPI00069BADE6|nr:nitrate- and nitrite sensing domain-containing protein [Streptomonospora alba]
MLLPSAAFIALWLAISGYLSWEAFAASAQAQAADELSRPAAVSLTAVMDERSQTVAYLERPDETRQELTEARQASDEQTGTVFDRFEKYRDYASGSIQDRMAEFEAQYRSIDDIRAKVDEGSASRSEVLQDYNRVMTAAADLFDAQSRDSAAPESISSGIVATDTFRVVDLLSRSDAQLTRSFTNGRLTHDDKQEFTRLTSSYHSTLEDVRGFLSPEQQRDLNQLMNGDDYKRLVEMENRIVDHEAHIVMDPVTGEHSHDTSVPMEQEEWEAAYAPVKDKLTEIGAAEASYSATVQAETATRSLMIAAAGTVGVALIGFLAISTAVGTTQRIVSRLARLRDETDHRANDLLPDLVERLRRNEPVNSAEAIPQLTTGRDEIGDVAESFDKAQRFAVDAAVRQSELAHGINRVFLSIAHRSQTLIHRQLRLLDRMEREQEDPEQLTDLFKLDHLATRSRRNAENLLILGGETPGRTFHKPMPLVDVLRGAISESGDYTRVERHQLARVALKGPAIADVIHLVAELVDNATTFSPPQSKVRLSSEQVPNGVVVEIEDRGLGMQDDELAAANEILANPPEFDVMRLNEKMRLGLFVVSRLAKRHEIGVRLRPSPYGGVQAIVLLPSVLIHEGSLPDSAFESTGERPRVVAPAPSRGNDSAAGGAQGDEEAEDDTNAVPAGDVLSPEASSEPAPDPSAAAPADSESASADEVDRTPSGLPRRGRSRVPAETTAVGGDGADAPTGPLGPESNGADPSAAPVADPPTAQQPAEPSPTADNAPGTQPDPEPAPSPNGGAADPAEAERATTPALDADGRPPLPKRTPQTNLAPQLYETSSAPGTGAASQQAEDGEDRSARLRHNMSAFQQGTRRGRHEGQQRQNDTDKDS